MEQKTLLCNIFCEKAAPGPSNNQQVVNNKEGRATFFDGCLLSRSE